MLRAAERDQSALLLRGRDYPLQIIRNEQTVLRCLRGQRERVDPVLRLLAPHDLVALIKEGIAVIERAASFPDAIEAAIRE